MKSTYKNFVVAIAVTLGALGTAQAQVKIGNNPATISPSAALEVETTNKGFLPPRVALTGTTDVSTIPSPATGLLVYNTTSAGSGSTAVVANKLYTWTGSVWKASSDLSAVSATSLAATDSVMVVGVNGQYKKMSQIQFKQSMLIPTLQFFADDNVAHSGGDAFVYYPSHPNVVNNSSMSFYTSPTNYFQAPETGYYDFKANTRVSSTANSSGGTQIQKSTDGGVNWTFLTEAGSTTTATNEFTYTATVTVYLLAGERVRQRVSFCYGCGGTNTVRYTSFTATRIL